MEFIETLTPEEAQKHRKALVKTLKLTFESQQSSTQLERAGAELRQIIIDKIYEGHQFQLSSNEQGRKPKGSEEEKNHHS